MIVLNLVINLPFCILCVTFELGTRVAVSLIFYVYDAKQYPNNARISARCIECTLHYAACLGSDSKRVFNSV
jgi:hypothetical protein